MVEMVGYLASVMLMISFMMKDVRKLRWINSVACALFIIYGFLLDISWPVVISNAFVLTTNVWHLTRRPS